jgi:hypothetical protein
VQEIQISEKPAWGKNYNYLTRLSLVKHRQEEEFSNHHPIVQHMHEFVECIISKYVFIPDINRLSVIITVS